MQTDTWDFDESQILEAIKKHEAKKVLLQLPDGIKMHAKYLVDFVNENADVDEVYVWQGSNFGACDIPVEARNVGVDLVIHFGHSAWNYKREVVDIGK